MSAGQCSRTYGTTTSQNTHVGTPQECFFLNQFGPKGTDRRLRCARVTNGSFKRNEEPHSTRLSLLFFPSCVRRPTTFPSPVLINKTPCGCDTRTFCLFTQSCNMKPTRKLAQTALFTQQPEELSTLDRTRLSYERARAIGRAYGTCIRVVAPRYTTS